MIPYRGDLNMRTARNADVGTFHDRQVQQQTRMQNPQPNPGASPAVGMRAPPRVMPVLTNVPAPGQPASPYGQMNPGVVGRPNQLGMGAPVQPLRPAQPVMVQPVGVAPGRVVS